MSDTTAAGYAGYPEPAFVLRKDTAAIPISRDPNGRIRLGTMIQLPGGVSVEITGDGFDEQTRRIAWEGSSYYIFLEQDQMEPRRAWAQSAG